MSQEWIGVRELARRVGRKHRAVQRAVQEGRIPSTAVRRAPGGRIVAVEYYAAAHAWADKTDLDQALRTSTPLRVASEPVQTSAPPSVPVPAPIDPYDAEALRSHPALEVALISLPAILEAAGVGSAVDSVLAALFGAMERELRLRGEPDDFIARELAIFRAMVAEERAQPGSWTE